MTRILGLESSCDETAAAIVTTDRQILANVVKSQIAAHAPYGGVVPEIAARNHIEWMEPVIAEALAQAKCELSDIDAIAVTAGPGLIGGLIVGLMTAKTLAAIYNKPLIAVNHLEGHALTVRLTQEVAFPYLLLLVSGGHCCFAVVSGVGRYRLLGSTRDDALGEAFDKCAKLLGLPYPGGPAVEALARTGNPEAYALPRPMIQQAGCDFSFSGLKTAVRQLVQQKPALTPQEKADIAASFQAAVVDCLAQRTGAAFAMLSEAMPLVVAGGVAANQAIRLALQQVAEARHSALYVAPPALCTDNAAMIAWAGAERFQLGMVDSLLVEPRARWPLSDLAN